MRTRLRPAGGFTMVELVATIVIVGVLAAVAAPRFFDRKIYDVRAYLDTTRAQLRYAQKIAIAQNRPVYVALGSNRVALTFGAVASGATLPVNMLQAPAGGNSGSAATRAACTGSAGYDSQWYCEGAPNGAALTATPAISGFYFDRAGQPFALTDATNTTTSTFAATTVTVTGDGASHSIVIEQDTGYVH